MATSIIFEPVRRSNPSSIKRTITFLLPNAAYPFVLIGVALEPFVRFKPRLDGSITYGDMLFAVAAVALAVEASARRTLLWAPLWLLVAAGFLMWDIAFQTLANYGVSNHDDVVFVRVILLTVALIPITVASQRLTSSLQLNVLIMSWLFASLLSGLIPLLQHQGWDMSFFKPYLAPDQGRMAGFTQHPNNLGLILAPTVCVCIAQALGARSLFLHALWLLAAGLTVHVIDLTGSRGSLLSALSGSLFVVVVLTLYRRKNESASRHLKSFGLILLAVLAYMVYSGDPQSAVNRLLGIGKTAAEADLAREQLFNLSMDRFGSHPFVGAGYRHFIDAHNTALSSMACGGLFGLMFFLLLALGFMAYAFRLLRMGLRGTRDFTMAVGLVGAYVCWLLMSVKETILIYRGPIVALGLMCLLCVNERNRNLER